MPPLLLLDDVSIPSVQMFRNELNGHAYVRTYQKKTQRRISETLHWNSNRSLVLGRVLKVLKSRLGWHSPHMEQSQLGLTHKHTSVQNVSIKTPTLGYTYMVGSNTSRSLGCTENKKRKESREELVLRLLCIVIFPFCLIDFLNSSHSMCKAFRCNLSNHNITMV